MSTSAAIYTYYGCTSGKNNCTGTELANIQWGSSKLTQETATGYESTTYLPNSDSVVTSWNDTLAIAKAPELWVYTNVSAVGITSYSIQTVSALVDPLAGLLNQY